MAATGSNNATTAELLTLHLRSNGFDGSLPQLPPSIRHFDAGNNAFSGELPFEYSTLTNLKNLNLDGNQLGGPLISFPPAI